jgi:hypothetical protein
MKLKLFMLSLGLLQLLASTTSCASHSAAAEMNTTQPYDLTWFQKRKLEKAALNGDAEAAFRVAQYYLFRSTDQLAQIHWLEVGAKNGSKNAQYNLVVSLIARKGPGDLDVAERLLGEMEKDANDADHTKALRYLRDDLSKAQGR